VKIRNPEDEKYFKDITLNNILQEISNETQDHIDEPMYHKEESKSQNTFYFQMMLFGLLPIALLLFFFTPFSQTDNNQVKKMQTKSIPQTQTDSIGRAQLKPKYVKHTTTTKPKEITPIAQNETPKTQREIAKASLKNSLLQQLGSD